MKNEDVGTVPFTVHVGSSKDHMFRFGRGEEEIGNSEEFRKPGTSVHNNVAALTGPGGQPSEYDVPN